jgi:hypothetical protein
MKNSFIKTSFGLWLATAAAVSAQAALIHFQLSPPGTDAAVGLSPSNQVPPATNSTGSGNTISGGIVFDTESNILHLAVGYGSAAGFTDLTAPPTAMHIHGPGAPGHNAAVLISLVPFDFRAPNPTNGGVIFANLAIPPDDVSNLLAGLDYINIHTPEYPGGEIRGQLVPAVATNSPPMVSCPAAATVECGTPAQVTVVAADPDGDALTIVWSVNGSAVQTNTLPASNPPALANVSFVAPLPLGTNAVAVTVTDTATNTASCGTLITVVDTTPPVIHAAWATPDVLWPPNHQMVEVRVHARVSDECDSVTWKIISVTSTEPTSGHGHGHGDTEADWQITGPHTVKLRAERSGSGSGRVYTLTIQATDASGNQSALHTVSVRVPHDQGEGKAAGRH